MASGDPDLEKKERTVRPAAGALRRLRSTPWKLTALAVTMLWTLSMIQLVHPMLFPAGYHPGWWEQDSFFNTPHVISHRGDFGGHPENTMAAFNYAYDHGVKVIEIDVRITSDGVPVVFHDPTYERTTDGEGKVSEQPWAGYGELLDAGSYFAPEYAGEGIPTVDEVFGWLKERPDLVLWVHIRFRAGDEILANAIDRSEIHSQVVIQLNAGEYSRFDHYQDCLGRAVIIKESFVPIALYNMDLCKHNKVQFMTLPDRLASEMIFDVARDHGIRAMLTRSFTPTEDHITDRFAMGAWGYIVNSADLAGSLSDLGEPPEARGL